MATCVVTEVISQSECVPGKESQRWHHIDTARMSSNRRDEMSLQILEVRRVHSTGKLKIMVPKTDHIGNT